VGAGPGAVDLLTMRAASRLKEADLVLHDLLVSDEVLALASRARVEAVGRRCGQEGTPVADVVRRMVTAAREGLRVARLKGGDPFVLARGGEEALGLAAAGVPFEVVPGLTTAVAAASLAGIPLTYRGVASSFVVVSGHDPLAWAPLLEAIPPRGTTVVVLMGLAARTRMAGTLRARGWDGTTPVAAMLSVSTPRAWSWRGTLDELDTLELPPDRVRGPGVLVIGDVVALAPMEVA
jgi:uroporphyrin-III C-methyltransferase/precorrin-2 dehydrogenase/sirohydrochlorin ferrochelatase